MDGNIEEELVIADTSWMDSDESDQDMDDSKSAAPQEGSTGLSPGMKKVNFNSPGTRKQPSRAAKSNSNTKKK